MNDLTRHIREWRLWDKLSPRLWLEQPHIPEPVRATIEEILDIVETDEHDQKCQALAEVVPPLETRSIYEIIKGIEATCDSILNNRLLPDYSSATYNKLRESDKVIREIMQPVTSDLTRLQAWLNDTEKDDIFYAGKSCENWWTTLQVVCTLIRASFPEGTFQKATRE